MIPISTHWDVVCITTTHMTVTVTVRVVRYSDGTAITEYWAVGGIAVDSIVVVLDDGVLGLVLE